MKELVGIGYTALLSNFTRLAKPYKLNYAITLRCQSRCLTCNIWKLKSNGELSIDEIREFAKSNNSFRWIALTGGEPFLRSDIVEVVRAFKESCKNMYLLTIPTNSLCNTDKVVNYVSQILELGVPKVAITLSLDGYREVHDRVRGVPGNYDRVMEMYRRFKELKKEHKNLSFFFGYTISKFNEGNLIKTVNEIRKDIQDVKYSDFHINLCQTSDNYYHNQGSQIKGHSDIVAGELEEIIRRREPGFGAISLLERAFLKGLLQFARTGRPPYKSMRLNASIFVDSWGNVYPSIMWNKKIANLREINYNLGNVWESDKAQEVRRMIREGKEPSQWTACEAYQTLLANASSIL